ncbi:hypothetical protein CLOSCI_03508 [[Clostridium] scindens ATCC 35704]|nr:hypothetical protein CLOSCI_03508 [[Clostridium] scindens ATCC 35704]
MPEILCHNHSNPEINCQSVLEIKFHFSLLYKLNFLFLCIITIERVYFLFFVDKSLRFLI